MHRAVNYLLTTLIVLVLALTASGATSKITKESIVSKEKQRTYYLFVPETIKAPAPLIVLLHGSTRNGESLVVKWKDLAEAEGIIIAGPDSVDSANWTAPKDGPEFLYDLVEALKQKYPINPRRVYLFGHSGGASFGLQMSLFEPEYFAATAVHAGALTGQAERLIDFAAAKRKVPLAIFSGTDDRSVPISMVRATRELLKKRDFPHHVVEMPNHDHNYYDIASQINRDAWNFLKKYELSEAPKYEPIQFR